MHDQMPVRVLDCSADREEHAQALLQSGLVLATPAVQGDALDEFEHQIRLAFAIDVGAEEVRDVRMVQTRQDAAFPEEVPEHRQTRRAANALDGHALFDLAIAAFGHPHLAHAAFSDHLQQPEGAEHRAAR